MKCYVDKFEKNKFTNYFPGIKHCYLDIETTGFNRIKDIIYLVGILYFNENTNNWTLKQFFLENPNNEKYIIEKTLSKIESFDLIITYNGENFDLPFIRDKGKKYDLNTFSLDIIKSFDLYKYVRKNQYTLEIPNLKLETLEKYLGYNRNDIYTGYQCIQFYKNYTKNKEEKDKQIVLQHNYEDLIYLLKVYEIKKVIENKKKININEFTLLIDNITFKNNFLYVEGTINPSIKIDIKNFSFNYSFITKDLEYFLFKVPVKQGYVAENIIANYIYSNEYNINIKSKHNYQIPNNIYILSVENKPELNNIKNLLFYTTKELFNF